MNETSLKGHWNELQAEAKTMWGKLSDDELQEIGGQKDKLLAKLKQHYGYGKEKAQEELDKFLKKAKTNSSGEYGQALSEGIRELGNKAQNFSHDLADKSEAYLAKGEALNQEAQKKINENCDAMLTYVKSHPVQSALIAAGLGLLLGKLLK